MKRQILFILFMIFFNVLHLSAIFIKGAIVSNDLDEIPRFKVYYNGIRATNDEEGFFTIPVEEKKQDSYHILICKDFEPRFDSVNTVKELGVVMNKPNRFFNVKRSNINSVQKKLDLCQKNLKTNNIKLQLVSKQMERQEEFIEFFESKNKPEKYNKRVKSCNEKIKTLGTSKIKLIGDIGCLKRETASLQDQYQRLQKLSDDNGDIWMIKERVINTKNFVAPQNCLIICMNPKIVDYVDNWKFFMPNNFVCLPRIILKSDLEIGNVRKSRSATRSSVKSELYSFDKNVFHEIKREQTITFPDRPGLKARLTI